jgi:hyperosmotically inducible protein
MGLIRFGFGLIRLALIVVVLGVLGVLAYGYAASNGWLREPLATPSVDADRMRETGGELARKAAETTKVAAARTEKVVGEAALTAKIKSKMALDDYIKARNIDVDTTGGVVTLSGTVQSAQERERALRVANETEGVTQVIDKLQIAK